MPFEHKTKSPLLLVSPTIKHLFAGYDITLFAYGVTGTGKTHTMRGGKSLADRGVIPRLLSNIYRKGRKIEKDSDGEKRIEVSMSYYEIYNDKVFDLFEPIDKRPPAGLPIRDAGGKTVVSGLTERPCATLKEFEQLYDQANMNRSTAGTKLNAHSSRSHAILCVKVSQILPDRTVISTASAIDLAGSEDNRRTDNNKERLVESSSINKSLFVLAQCVEAIAKKHSRIPYRESKMTRILSLGQNNGLTVMILNLAPTRSFHLDTLSTLQVANRTKKIEVREVENEPIFKGPPKQTEPLQGASMQRQPLRPIPAAANIGLTTTATGKDKPSKAFSVYAEKNRLSGNRPSTGLKRPADLSTTGPRPVKALKPTSTKSSSSQSSSLSRSDIESLVNRMVDEKLAAKALDSAAPTQQAISSEVQRRLEALEYRVESKEDSRAEGLQFLLMAKQHQVRGEDASALRMYRLALPFFPENEKLQDRMVALQRKLGQSSRVSEEPPGSRTAQGDDDYQYRYAPSENEADELPSKTKSKSRSSKTKFAIFTDDHTSALPIGRGDLTPRTEHLLRIINTRDLAQIRSLKGVGAKKAEAIVSSLCEMGEEDLTVGGLERLGESRGVGVKSLETMRRGVVL